MIDWAVRKSHVQIGVVRGEVLCLLTACSSQALLFTQTELAGDMMLAWALLGTTERDEAAETRLYSEIDDDGAGGLPVGLMASRRCVSQPPDSTEWLYR